MRRLLTITFLTLLGLSACQPEEQIISGQEIRFSMRASDLDMDKGGRTQSSIEPKSVMVTILTDDGQIAADRKELILYKFGNEFLSAPLTLTTTGNSNYRLSEFFVLDSDHVIRYVTPREGSEMAHLVADPLEIDFVVSTDIIITVTPEVLEVDENSNPETFGYAQFGFRVVKTTSAVFSSFIKGASNFELTTSHLKIEGLNTTDADAIVQWNYETDLDAKANTVTVKEAIAYRITATKEGYTLWQKNISLEKGTKVDITFESMSGDVDVYVAGFEKNSAGKLVAKYWKNGNETLLSDGVNDAVAKEIVAINGDIHVVGTELINSHHTAKYWKNGVSQHLEDANDAILRSISINGNDIYLVGSTNCFDRPSEEIPTFWKNGVAKKLTNEGEVIKGQACDISVAGNDVFISGTSFIGTKGIATYWKNEKPVFLTGTDINDAHGYDIEVINNDVYVCGSYWDNNYFPNPVATYWKNGERSSITPIGKYASYAFSIMVNDNNVYIAGTEYEEFYDSEGKKKLGPIGKYWKNQQAVALTNKNYSEISSITVSNGNVYTAGNASVPPSLSEYAHYWKNQESKRLGLKLSSSNSIVVVSK